MIALNNNIWSKPQLLNGITQQSFIVPILISIRSADPQLARADSYVIN